QSPLREDDPLRVPLPEASLARVCPWTPPCPPVDRGVPLDDLPHWRGARGPRRAHGGPRPPPRMDPHSPRGGGPPPVRGPLPRHRGLAEDGIRSPQPRLSPPAIPRPALFQERAHGRHHGAH